MSGVELFFAGVVAGVILDCAADIIVRLAVHTERNE